MRKAAVWMALGLVIGAGSSASAQYIGTLQGRFESIIGLRWRSSCMRPYFSSSARSDEYAARRLRSEFSEYQTCIVNQARNDSTYAARAVNEGAIQELRQIQEEARSMGWRVQ